ncbi:CrcB family protein [Methanocalculus sp.]|uniref:fluoride efflux transporter FluC n=1 Tax=Methanocalculus sp. TaxID=2004547 RepID=UPI002722F8A2|nr:CrcB family protein [Methanocalculus sp.]MDO8841504.1 CrcB family protein [Methanocalculus sp.]
MEYMVLVGIGGAIGSIMRFEISKIQPVRGIPIGTFLVNVTGSFLLSLIVFSSEPEDLINLFGFGCLGGFTTFSTFSFETFRMLENHDYSTMGGNILLNMGGSLIGVYLGYLLISLC